jgi:PKD repeat protein
VTRISERRAKFNSTVTGGSGSYSYSWDFKDGSNEGQGQADPEHTFAADGTYLVILTVTDNNTLEQNSSSQSVTVPIP